MKLKPEIQAAVGGAGNQVSLSLDLLNQSELTDNQRFHLRQLEEVLCTDALVEAEPL